MPKDDPAVYDMLCEADAIGVFQVESRAQMNMLPRLQAARILRSGGGSGDRAARPDPGRHGASLSQAPQEQRDNPDKMFEFPKPGPEHGPPDELDAGSATRPWAFRCSRNRR